MSFTTHRNLQKVDVASQVNKFLIYDGDLDALDKGQQIKAAADEAFSAFLAVYQLGNFRVARALAGQKAIGCATVASSGASADVYVVFDGVVSNPAWNWSAGLVYVSASTPGALTQTPTSEVLGRAISATEILVYPPGTR